MSFLGTCEESIVKWRGYRHACLTLLDEKLLSIVAADFLRLIKKFRKRVFKPKCTNENLGNTTL